MRIQTTELLSEEKLDGSLHIVFHGQLQEGPPVVSEYWIFPIGDIVPEGSPHLCVMGEILQREEIFLSGVQYPLHVGLPVLAHQKQRSQVQRLRRVVAVLEGLHNLGASREGVLEVYVLHAKVERLYRQRAFPPLPQLIPELRIASNLVADPPRLGAGPQERLPLRDHP